MQAFSTDTSAKAHEIYVQLLRRKTPAERVGMVKRLNEAVDTMALARLRREYSEDTPRKRRLRLQALKYGDETMKRVFGWDPAVEGR